MSDTNKRDEYIKKLESIASLSREEAKRLLIAEVEEDSKADIAKIIKETEDEAKAIAHKKAQEIIGDAIKHGALDFLQVRAFNGFAVRQCCVCSCPFRIQNNPMAR